MDQKHAGQCQEQYCLLDAQVGEFCNTHRDTTCENCGKDEWEHKTVKDEAGQEIKICPTGMYK